MDLIQSLNETNNQQQYIITLFESNIDLIAEDTETDAIDLTESIIEWLAQLQKDAVEGKLNVQDGDNPAAAADQVSALNTKIQILGATMALTDADMPAAMNVKSPDKILKIANSPHQRSDVALAKMAEMGRSSAKGFSKKAEALMKADDKNALIQAAKDLQNRAKKVILMKKPPVEQRPSAPGQLGLADKMAEPAKI